MNRKMKRPGIIKPGHSYEMNSSDDSSPGRSTQPYSGYYQGYKRSVDHVKGPVPRPKVQHPSSQPGKQSLYASKSSKKNSFCGNCGQEWFPDNVYCTSCGKHSFANSSHTSVEPPCARSSRPGSSRLQEDVDASHGDTLHYSGHTQRAHSLFSRPPGNNSQGIPAPQGYWGPQDNGDGPGNSTHGTGNRVSLILGFLIANVLQFSIYYSTISAKRLPLTFLSRSPSYKSCGQ